MSSPKHGGFTNYRAGNVLLGSPSCSVIIIINNLITSGSVKSSVYTQFPSAEMNSNLFDVLHKCNREISQETQTIHRRSS